MSVEKWVLDDFYITCGFGVDVREEGEAGELVCRLSYVYDTDMAKAFERARLIAAAPDLLAACLMLLKGYHAERGEHEPMVTESMKMAESAVAKALGPLEPA